MQRTRTHQVCSLLYKLSNSTTYEWPSLLSHSMVVPYLKFWGFTYSNLSTWIIKGYCWGHERTRWGLVVGIVACCVGVHVYHCKMCCGAERWYHWWCELGRGKIVLGIGLRNKLEYGVALCCCTSCDSLFVTHDGVEDKFVLALFN